MPPGRAGLTRRLFVPRLSPDPALSVGLLWRDVMDTIAHDRQAIPEDRYTQVIYEDFVASPLEHLRYLADRGDLRWNDEVERIYAAQAERVALAGRNDAWRQHLTAEDLERLMPIIAPVMRCYRYDVES